MSQQNVELVASVIERWNSGEWVVPDAYDPELEWLPHRSGTEGAYHGIEGIERFAEDTREMFELFELRYELLDLGERVLGWGTIHFRRAAERDRVGDPVRRADQLPRRQDPALGGPRLEGGRARGRGPRARRAARRGRAGG